MFYSSSFRWDKIDICPTPLQLLFTAMTCVWRWAKRRRLVKAFVDESLTTTPSHLENIRLVERSLHGDHGAFRQLFEQYSPMVYRIAYRMTGSPDDAADLTQDVFVRAFERLHTLKDGQAFHAWITRLAVNMAHDKARRKRLDTLSLDAPPPGHDIGSEWQVASDAPDHDTMVLSDELAAKVQQALQALTPDHRLVVVLHHLEGMAVEDIARAIGKPAGTVKSRLARARAELKRQLEGYVGEHRSSS